MKIYRIVDDKGRVVSGTTRPIEYYATIGDARNAKSQLDHYMFPRELTIEEAELGDFHPRAD